MRVNITLSGVAVIVKALTYPFPKAPKVPEGYTLTDEKGEQLIIAKTGGGKYPSYIYFFQGDKSYYLPKNTTPDSGTSVFSVEDVPTPTEAELSPTLGGESEPEAESTPTEAESTPTEAESTPTPAPTPKKAPRTSKK